jgi:hypothetical protein
MVVRVESQRHPSPPLAHPSHGVSHYVMSSGLAEKPVEVARDTETVVASRLNAMTESHSTALCLHSPTHRDRRPGAARTRTDNDSRPLRTGGVRRSGGSNVGCRHAATCPLFPLLRASLQGWRMYYCDSEDQWHDCARYQLSLTGERVPISLLPNGASARHLEPPADENRSGAADPRQAPRQTPPPGPDPYSPQTGTWSQPGPDRPPERPGPGTASPGMTAPFAAPPPEPVGHHRPSPPAQFPQPPDRLARHARPAPDSKRGWWARFADWMKGPA